MIAITTITEIHLRRKDQRHLFDFIWQTTETTMRRAITRCPYFAGEKFMLNVEEKSS